MNKIASQLMSIAVKVLKESSWKKKIGILLGAGIGGALTFFAGPPVLVAMGFTSAGITAGSIAASMMSFASSLGIGGGLVACLQSAGAAGLGIGAFAKGASVGATVTGSGFVIASKVKKE